mgnify:CR=1 FL=1
MKNKLTDRSAFIITAILSIVVVLLVTLMFTGIFSFKGDVPSFIYSLPLLHAILNGSTALLLIFSLRAIKNKQIDTHKTLNMAAFLLSSLFLVSYVVYHTAVPSTSFGGEGILRYFYLFILLTHILCSIVVLPLVLISFWYGISNQIVKHTKLVKIAFPVWLYAAFTGGLVYVLISPYYVN